MDRDAWIERNRRSMEGVFASFARSTAATTIEADGAFAIVNPATPERSVFNSVLYSDAEALAASYERIAAAYAEHDCAWTVWVPENDAEAASMLERAGHRLDAEPRCMGLELDALRHLTVLQPGQVSKRAQLDEADAEIAVGRDIDALALLNDRAYGYREGTFLRGIGPEADLIVYLAFLDGAPAATVAARDVEGDCSIWCVATLPEARGRGLSAALMRRALRDAHERGRATSTLQATKLGRPVYERVGYLDFGALQMWERRPPERV